MEKISAAARCTYKQIALDRDAPPPGTGKTRKNKENAKEAQRKHNENTKKTLRNQKNTKKTQREHKENTKRTQIKQKK